jgi:hypothetical protein
MDDKILKLTNEEAMMLHQLATNGLTNYVSNMMPVSDYLEVIATLFKKVEFLSREAQNELEKSSEEEKQETLASQLEKEDK